MARRSNSRSTPTRTTYHIDIYRMGYYGGNGARIGDDDPRRIGQPPQTNPSPQLELQHGVGRRQQLEGLGLVDAVRPTPSRACTSPSWCATTARSAKIRSSSSFATTKGIPTCSFRPRTTTWQAYNTWGGTSLYSLNYPGVGRPRPSATPGRSPIARPIRSTIISPPNTR